MKTPTIDHDEIPVPPWYRGDDFRVYQEGFAAGCARAIPRAIPADEWDEDDGEVLWWRFPVDEPPYIGSPLCDDWLDDYWTHFTRIVCPDEPAP